MTIKINYGNIVVRAKYFSGSSNLTDLKTAIANVMLSRGAIPLGVSIDALFGSNRYNVGHLFSTGAMNFQSKDLTLTNKNGISNRVGALFNRRKSLDFRPLDGQEYLKILGKMMNSAPVSTEFLLGYMPYVTSDKEKRTGITIQIKVTPAVMAKAEREIIKAEISENEYNHIIAANRGYLESIANDLDLQELEVPSVQTEPKKTERLFQEEFIITLPADVRQFLVEANGCYANHFPRASAAMTRAAVEAHVTKRLRELGHAKDIDSAKEFVPLSKKLNLISNLTGMRKYVEEIQTIKWLGDNALHDADIKIEPDDINSQAIRVKDFLTKLSTIPKK